MMRERGFTIVEVLVALFVASVLSVFVLSLTRSQLVTYEMQGQVNSTQENVREAFDYVETALRKACAGMSSGKVRVHTSDATKFNTACFRVYDGAIFGSGATVPAVGSVGSFQSSAPATKADAMEIIYGDGSGISMVTAFDGTNQITIGDWSPFSDGDYVLVSDMSAAYLFQIRLISTSQVDATKPPTAIAQFAGVASNPSAAAIFDISTRIGQTNCWIMPARSISLYVDITTDTKNPRLMLDPDGVRGTVHTDAEELAEGVEDLQVAIAYDQNGDGYMVDNANATDDWIGNAGTTEITTSTTIDPFATAWDSTNLATPSVRQIRLTMIVRSLNQYAGASAALSGAENRNSVFGGVSGTSAVASKYRQLRTIVSPRAWNTRE